LTARIGDYGEKVHIEVDTNVNLITLIWNNGKSEMYP
jgi:hypothetical protein